ncbi:MAG TPA: amidohydrolase family protein [Blastocatellia bacterium]|nr:amidohydrolase family protein [Blastocatellia bacterium]HMV83542.1 amidohydrolase family protein [Blastocatellia bacterium]HMY73110.1 amidohydrolase family protein [Blastocatellia bacterium]HMZ17265.1 amidohydrolase family protein [Blastocatellia bacterium]HNG28485.1 amidohydrolase family protein [Blastocatellia bacterium]
MLKKIIQIVLATTLLAALALAQSKTEQGTYAIRNAKIVTVTGATIERGTVLIKNGKIEAVGANVAVPKDAKVIDATGQSVYPGLIDSNTILGLTEVMTIVNGTNGTVDTTELGDFNPNVKALTAVNPNSEHIPVARMNGVTTVLTCPRGGLISGQCALMNLDGWTQHEMKLLSPAAMQVNYPTTGFGGRGGFGGGFFAAAGDQQRQQRDRQLESLKKKLEDAQAYAQARDAEAKDKTLPHRSIDLGLEALIPVIKGEVPVIVSANSATEIKGAIELADKYKLKLIITGGDDAAKVAKELKEKNIPVVLGSVNELPRSEDAPYDEGFARAAELHKAGIKFAFATANSSENGPGDVRLLPYQAGTSAAFGLPKDEALKGVTIYPAQIFGVDKLVGSIEPGKLANLVITDGDILEFRTRIKQIFIAGRPVDMSNKHQRLNDKFKDRP